MMMKLDPAEWRDIPGYDGIYQANAEGQIRRCWPDGRTRVLKPCRHYQKGNIPTSVVNMYGPDGRRRLRNIGKMIAETFLGPCPEGMFVYHKNGMLTDNSIYNLAFISKEEFWSMIGRKRSRRKNVVKLAKSGEIVEVYKSAKHAAAANYISYSMMLSRCNGVPKLGPAGDGYDYAWEDDKESIKAAKRRLQYVPQYKIRKRMVSDGRR